MSAAANSIRPAKTAVSRGALALRIGSASPKIHFVRRELAVAFSEAENVGEITALIHFSPSKNCAARAPQMVCGPLRLDPLMTCVSAGGRGGSRGSEGGGKCVESQNRDCVIRPH